MCPGPDRSGPSIVLTLDAPRSARELEACFDLRWRILRAPWDQPPGSERDEHEADAEHVLARDAEGAIVGVGRLHTNAAGEAQIRYMAVEEGYRRQGVGRAIAARLEQLAAERGARCVVLDARDTAVEFYRSLGYEPIGPGPMRFGAIPHTRMRKRLPAKP